jgi:hypothetical protein
MRTIALVIVLFCTSGMICGQSRSAAIINPSRRVPFFAVKQGNLIDALLSRVAFSALHFVVRDVLAPIPTVSGLSAQDRVGEFQNARHKRWVLSF